MTEVVHFRCCYKIRIPARMLNRGEADQPTPQQSYIKRTIVSKCAECNSYARTPIPWQQPHWNAIVITVYSVQKYSGEVQIFIYSFCELYALSKYCFSLRLKEDIVIHKEISLGSSFQYFGPVNIIVFWANMVRVRGRWNASCWRVG